MKRVKRFISTFAMMIGLSCGNAHAGIPVIDGAHIAESIVEAVEVLAQWASQYGQMAEQIMQLEQQYDQSVTTYNSISGVRGMGSLVNTPARRSYMPDDYQNMLNNGYGNSSGIRSAVRKFDVSSTSLDGNSDSAKAFKASAQQSSLNRATSEESYKQASDRIGSIQTLLDKVNDVSDEKDVLDLQARIQAEQVMVQNENVKLTALSQLQQSQRDLAYQQAAEIRMKSTQGTVARF
jgi:type IV secretion system protein VirB5